MWTELFADVMNPESPRRIFYITLAAALIAALLVAFSLVCTGQVQRAQERDNSLQVQRAALSDCLDAARNITRSSCLRRVATSPPDQVPMNFVPVNLAYR